ncbi:hypothetical protein ACSQ67_000759 [Phaseolus vulgaris]
MVNAAVVFAVLVAAIWVAESEYIEYNTTQRIVPDKINVHLVPHSHDDVGWLKTVDQYYVGANNSIRGACVQNVLDSVISSLLEDKNRKFIYVEMAFFQRWWRQQSKAMKIKVKELVNSGQLEFINGGMCMHDEATPHYIDLIDQTTLGHQFIKEEFGKVPRVGWQIDPFGHSAVQAYLLGAEVSRIRFTLFARIDYQDRAKRLKEKTLEVIWQGCKSLGSSSQDDILLFDYNVQERVNDFVYAALAQANVTKTNHMMWTMGTDFRYQYANSWFRQMDKFIHYVNQDGRVNALYSTPSIYTDAKYAANEYWPLKVGDFFPYADHPNAYWTGYFTSRPGLKGYVRVMSSYYQAARQLEYFKGRNETGPNTDALADALAIAQHHDAVSGTERQHVASDYALRLSLGYEEAERLVASALASLCPLLNISYCPLSETTLVNGKSLVIVVYNPLAWKREDVIRIPVWIEVMLVVNGFTFVVTDLRSRLLIFVCGCRSTFMVASPPLVRGSRSEFVFTVRGRDHPSWWSPVPVSATHVFVQDLDGKKIESQLLPLSNATLTMRKHYVRAYTGKAPGSNVLKYWLAFPVSVTASVEQSYSYYSGNDGTDKDPQPDAVISLLGIFWYSILFGKCKEYQKQPKKGIVSPNSIITDQFAPKIATIPKKGPKNDWAFYRQASGAYVFRPNGSFPIKSDHQVSFSVLRGPILDEVHQQLNPWVSQITRVFKAKEHAEIEFTVGPIPVDDGIGKEIITQFKTTMKSNKTFYTDSSGRDFIKRFLFIKAKAIFSIARGIVNPEGEDEVFVDMPSLESIQGWGENHLLSLGRHQKKVMNGTSGIADFAAEVFSTDVFSADVNQIRDFRTDWDLQVNQPIAGNYYPVNLGIYIQDSSVEFSVLVDRSVGGSSLEDGQMELMLHRRLLHDDARGVGEVLNETVCIADKCEGLTVKFFWCSDKIQGKLYLRIDQKGEGAKWRRTVGQELYSPLMLAFTEQDGDNLLHFAASTFSGTDSSYNLPNNIALLTLQEFKNGKVLVRLAHLYEINKVTEMSLSANQERVEMEKRKLDWKVEGSTDEPKVVRGGPVDPTNLVVELAPMEIRTFFIDLNPLQTVSEAENHMANYQSIQ